MKVLIFGASGFIGLPAAQALSRAGHIVYGVTRSETKAQQLAAAERTFLLLAPLVPRDPSDRLTSVFPVFPIVGEPTDTQAWAHLIPTIDVVIGAVGGTADLRTVAVTLLNAVATTAQSTRPVGSPKITFIYTTGTWIHGSNTDEIVSDTTPLLNPVALVAWCPAVEQIVLKDDRAAFKDEQVTWFGKPGVRLSVLHVDDLADVYVRAVEKAPILGGLAIDASNNTTESVDEFLRKLIQVSGAKGPHGWIEPPNPFEEALSSTVLVRPYLARSLLGWQPKKPGLTDGLPLYYTAWKASRGEQPNEKLFATTK
ncbi:NAD(P)-binding protein [Imleria badia]|nr:NAD(P)-binding protein [Imleria badia]